MIHEVIKDKFYIDADNLDEEFSIIHVLGDLPYPDEDNYRIDNEYYRYLQDNLNKGQHLFELQVGSLEEEVELLKYFIERGWKIRTIAQRNYLSGLVLDSVRKNCKKIILPLERLLTILTNKRIGQCGKLTKILIRVIEKSLENLKKTWSI